MFEKAMKRPGNYFKLPEQQQWEIDSNLGILDWDGKMTAEQQTRFNAHFGIIKATQSAGIYVPVNVSAGFRNLRPGSAIVGIPMEDGLKIYYEGNMHGATNLHNSRERIVCAAGRLFHRYPTVAMSFVPADSIMELDRVGTVHDDYRIEIDNEAAANLWFSKYRECK